MKHPSPYHFLVCLALLWSATGRGQYIADGSLPDANEELLHAAERAYRAGDLATAVRLTDQLIERDAGHVNALLQRGACHNLLGDHERAVADFSAVIGIRSDHIWAYICRGTAYLKLGRHELAIADLNTVIALDPKNEEAYNNRGWARKASGDIGGACKDWNTSKRLGNAEAKIILKNNRCK